MATITTNVRRGYGVTPEIYLPKPIDNSRLVRVADPRQRREMQVFSCALGLLCLLLLAFCWQHYSSIEYGYRNEATRQMCDQLREANRQLRLQEAQLREPRRIDSLAQQMGLQAPIAGQFVTLHNPTPEPSAPVVAQATAISVVSVAP
jgi:hypothetical protein